MKRVLALGCVLAAALAACQAASAAQPAFTYDPALSVAVKHGLRAATFKGEKPLLKKVYVKCYRDADAFEQPLLARFGIGEEGARFLTAYYAGGGEVHMRAGSCHNARLFARRIVRWDTAAAFSVLMHEALHRQGIENERAATCLANDSVRWAGKVFGFTDRSADRARVLAFAYMARTVPSAYRMSRFECLRLISEDRFTWWRLVRSPRLEKLFD